MAITNEFMDAVRSGKILRVRIMLKDSLLLDPTAAQFDEMEQYAVESMGNIYVEQDGEKFNFDIDAWNEDYLNQQLVSVVTCFSKERIELLKKMVSYLYKDKAEKIRSEQINAHCKHRSIRKRVGTGVTVAGTALAIAGICTSRAALTIGGICVSHTTLTIVGVAVAAAGIALTISDKEEA